MSWDLDDYVDVATRIAIFRDKHPNGSLRAHVIRWPSSELPFIAVEAEAFRSPEDELPGIGLAWEPFPGKTPYTKNSELMVAETSAWGRAIVAALAADTKRGIASQNEVQARTSAGGTENPSSSPPSTEQPPAGTPEASKERSVPVPRPDASETAGGGGGEHGDGEGNGEGPDLVVDASPPPTGPITTEQRERLLRIHGTEAKAVLRGKRVLGRPMPALDAWSADEAMAVLAS